jgi:hypothetical protein
MKKIIVLLCLLGALCIPRETHAQRISEQIDSLTATRTSVTLDVSGFLYTSVIFETLSSTDSVRISNQTDSVGVKHGVKRIPLYLRNASTFAEYASGSVIGLASPLEIQPLSPNIKKLRVEMLDTGAGIPTAIYFRYRMITY